MKKSTTPATERSAPLRRDEGFTLVELLVVIIIIGILAAIAIPVFLRQREQSYVAAMRSDLRTAAALMETYAAEHGNYPANTALLAPELRWSPTNVLAVEYAGNEVEGFCLRATNPHTSDTVYYDNLAGGLQPLGTGCLVR